MEEKIMRMFATLLTIVIFIWGISGAPNLPYAGNNLGGPNAAAQQCDADFGDAPDNDLACQVNPGNNIIARYPTQLGTTNALPGRTAPFHFPLGAADYWLGGPPTYEPDAIEAITCDWIFGPPCDFD